MQRPIPIGVDDFKEIRDNGGCFVDKSLLIHQVLQRKLTKVFLFTRPRRFGKSLNLSMLDAYLNIRYRGNTWFDGLKISEARPDDPEKNSNIIVWVNLKDLSIGSFDSFRNGMRHFMMDLYDNFPELKDSDRITDNMRARYLSILRGTSDDEELKASLRYLTEMLSLHHGRKVIILMDEYDRAINALYGSSVQSQVMPFLSEFLSQALKSNSALRFAVMTGVMQVAKASIFSGLNNLSVNNIFVQRYDEMFGFTPDEVRSLCAEYGRPDKFDEVRDWYDGYRFGDVEIYNPWSVLSYIDAGFVPRAYWCDTSRNTVINTMLERTNTENFGRMLALVSGDSVVSSLVEAMSYDDVDHTDEALLSLMAMSGYLRAEPEGDMYEVSLPNREVKGLVQSTMRRMVVIDTSLYTDFCAAVLKGDTDVMHSTLIRVLERAEYLTLRDERSYELILMTVLCAILDHYDIRIEAKQGNGRLDILMTSRERFRPSMVFELKKAEKDDELVPEAEGALAQIHRMRYYAGMRGKVLLYGIAFRGVIPCIRSDAVDL